MLAARRAAEEAAKYNTVNIAATGKAGKYTGARCLDGVRTPACVLTRRRLHFSRADIPAQSSWKLTKGGAFVHICANETIQGVEFKARPPHASEQRSCRS